VTAATRLRLDAAQAAALFWPEVAARSENWCAGRGVSLRDVLVMLPYAGLLPPARAAFAQRGGWQPRIETSCSLAATQAPPLAIAGGQITFDATIDRLSAAALLQGQRSGMAWATCDGRAFDAAVTALVNAAQALLRAAYERMPESRDAFFLAWRTALTPVNGPGASERWLARIALEWAAAADPPAQDVLWQQQPAAWIGIQAGGSDELVENLFAAATAHGTPVMWIEADPPDTAPFDAVAHATVARRWLCDGLEGEAQAAVLAVLEALDSGHVPVALIAQDRLVVRRIRALLERAHVALRDETGWTLSTARSAARLLALLRAADPAAGRDALLDWLKCEAFDPPAVQQLEAAWRRGSEPEARAQALWDSAQGHLQPLRFSGYRSLAAWLRALDVAVPAMLRSLADDAAGRPLLAALHLDGQSSEPAWLAAAESTQFDLPGFSSWVEATLEAASFVPPGAPDASVVITPMPSAMLRPFAAIVMPGCDNLHLGDAAVTPGLLPEPMLRDFGMNSAQRQRARERLAFSHLLRAPNLTLLRRRSDDGEPLAWSLLVDHAWQVRRRLGQPAPEAEAAPLPCRVVLPAPHSRPAPGASTVLPSRLSASSVEALRACPYRFFALTLLGLREAPEFEAALEKRDYGTWLHGVLLRFHAARPVSDAAATDRARLLAAADAEQAALALDAAQLLPFRAAFQSFAVQYLEWLHARDAEGWRFEAGEVSLKRNDPRLQGVQLDGRIDRIDAHAADASRQLVDYKTGSAQSLKQRVAEPLEDTQLAFYAALMADVDGKSLVRAIYLALDDRKPPQPIEHPNVSASAEQLVEGLAHDLARLRAGAGLPALGEGNVCEYCEARGLCRRDHWASDVPS
jgi:ATP-dependent helicase/nuclease subunit B